MVMTGFHEKPLLLTRDVSPGTSVPRLDHRGADSARTRRGLQTGSKSASPVLSLS
jgi:hypothetical protein